MKPSEKIWWIKAVASLAVAGITLATQVFLGMDGIAAFMFGVIIYLALSNVLSNVMGVDKTRGLKIGVGAYFFIWITVWVLLYTCVQTAG